MLIMAVMMVQITINKGFMENGDQTVDGNERSDHWLVNLESRFEARRKFMIK